MSETEQFYRELRVSEQTIVRQSFEQKNAKIRELEKQSLYLRGLLMARGKDLFYERQE